MNNEYEKFYANIRKVGNSFVVTIPSNVVRFSGFEEGESVKVMIQKHGAFEDGDDKVQNFQKAMKKQGDYLRKIGEEIPEDFEEDKVIKDKINKHLENFEKNAKKLKELMRNR